GPPGPALEYFFRGKHRGTTKPITEPVNLVDIAITPDGAGWGIGGDRVLYRQAPDGTVEAVLDIAAYQATDLDPYNNPMEDPAESNPYGIAALRSNDVLIADAAGNDVIRVSPDGDAVTVARWPRRLVKTDRLGDPTLPPKLLAEAVPTSIAIGRDGWAYVGQLVGFPGRPGSAHIWRVNPNAEDATCDAKVKTRDCKVWKSGFTSIIDLAFDPRNGTLYVYEIAKAGWLKFEEGFASGKFPPAVLLEVRRGHKPRELVRGKLSEPGGVAVARNGSIFVTDGMFSNGRLLRVRP
ncbi:MAG: ScyD/ScyE family protein, partial [Candidatus Limnocylindrales bacterium]